MSWLAGSLSDAETVMRRGTCASGWRALVSGALADAKALKLRLAGVSEEVRALLLLGNLVHLGKQATYGHGWYQLKTLWRFLNGKALF